MDNIRPTWAEIDLAVIKRNFIQIRSRAGKAKVMAVVKANAYGHGMGEVARVCAQNGADFFGVATVEEALELWEYGYGIPILVLGYTPLAHAREIVKYGIRATVFNEELAEAISKEAMNQGLPGYIHIKMDTGMGRLGFHPNPEALQIINRINGMPGLILEGIYTHFAAADWADKTYTYEQFNRFNDWLTRLGKCGIHIPIKHCSNSAGLIDLPETVDLDMVRAGIVLYGLYPSREVDRESLPITPAMRLKSRIVAVRTVEPGHTVSYGRTYQCKEATRVATVPIGYADGFNRRLSNKVWGMVRGQKAPQIGTICMDQCMFDVTHIEEAQEGDEILLFGRPEDGITADDVASILGTINYEVVCGVSSRVPGLYR